MATVQIPMGRADLKARTWQYLATNRDGAVHRRLARAARSYLEAHEGAGNYVLELDGELRVLEIVAGATRASPVTLFDVGANQGEWSVAAGAAFPDATIHAFEPVSSTVAMLRAATDGLGDRIAIHPVGLGDEPGDLTINVPSDGSALSSLYDEIDADGRTEVVHIERGDDRCTQLGVDHIRFLKVDTEGWDHRVLAGFEATLAASAIDVVQFEYGPWALHTRFLLRDFYTLLEGHGMVVGKVYPTSVEFGPYRAELEDFRGLNFLAVKRSDDALVRALRG